MISNILDNCIGMNLLEVWRLWHTWMILRTMFIYSITNSQALAQIHLKTWRISMDCTFFFIIVSFLWHAPVSGPLPRFHENLKDLYFSSIANDQDELQLQKSMAQLMSWATWKIWEFCIFLICYTLDNCIKINFLGICRFWQIWIILPTMFIFMTINLQALELIL
jgi:hypothetical protein